jgi:hypothetical protein
MSFRLVQPSLMLNSYNLSSGMKMEYTWDCPKNTKIQDVVNWIHYACHQTKKRHLHHVVMNFHGPGETPIEGYRDCVLLGEKSPETGFGTSRFVPATYYTLDLGNVDEFSRLKGHSIGTIWFHSCAMARTYKSRYLCQRIAECAGCNVVAAQDDQEEWWSIIDMIFMPYGCIDDYEGKVYIWDKNGIGKEFKPNGGHWK